MHSITCNRHDEGRVDDHSRRNAQRLSMSRGVGMSGGKRFALRQKVFSEAELYPEAEESERSSGEGYW